MRFLTINQTAKELGLPAYAVRTLQKQGQVPGFYNGNRYYVNLDLFKQKLTGEMGKQGE